jgi:hypothetical protein
VTTHDKPDWDEHPELENMAKLLDQADAEERSVLEAAALLDDAPGLDMVQSTLESEWGEEQTGRGPNGWLRALIIPFAAAAAVVTAMMIWGGGNGTGSGPFDQPSDQALGQADRDFGIVYPVDEVTDWNRIEWKVPESMLVTLTVRDLNDDVVYGPQSTMETSLSLSSEITDKWPDEIFIELEAKDPSDQHLLIHEVRASLKGARE